MSEKKEHNSAELELPVIINKPQLQSSWQRGIFAVITCFAWLFWFYLFMPLFTLIGWIFFGHTVKSELIQKWQLYGFYILIIVALGLALLMWAYYNYIRFKGADRRGSPSPLRDEDLAKTFELRPEEVEHMHKAQIVRFWHSENGKIKQYQVDKLLPIEPNR